MVPLAKFEDGWRFLDDGSDLSGVNWTTNNYNDAQWKPGPPPSKSPGLFGFEDSSIYPYPLRTPLARYKTDRFESVITHYFRTTFQFDGNPQGVALVASNFVDDGVIVYLNGVELYRLRVPANARADTPADMVSNEGVVEVITNIGPHALRQGENVLAAELHQNGYNSSDAVFGMSLTAMFLEPVTIIEPPRSQTIVEAKPVTFSVSATGEYLSYQWFKNEIAIAGATNFTYTQNNVPISMNGSVFHVVVSNPANTVRSSNAVLSVVVDTFGPKLASAVVRSNLVTATVTNAYMFVAFDEPVRATGATNPANYQVTLRDGSGSIGLAPGSRIIYNGSFARLILETGLDPTKEYVLTANGMIDAKGNIMATNSQIGIGQMFVQKLFGIEQIWRFANPFQYPSQQLNPCEVLGSSWREPGFDDSTWEAGQGIFYFLPANLRESCLPGRLMTPLIHFTDLPAALFRTRFEATSATRVDLVLNGQAVSGAVMYLNGVEFFRNNMPNGPIECSTYASTNASGCFTNTVTATNLVTGTNVLAVEVHQARRASPSSSSSPYMLFGMEASATLTKTPDLTSGNQQ